MAKQEALYVGRSHRRQVGLRANLTELGFELHNAPTISSARELVRSHHYYLILLNFDTIGEETFSLCSFIRFASAHPILIVLMAKAKINVEEQLFDCGVNDVVTGRQTSPRVLAKRIRAHLRNSGISQLKTNIIRLKDTMVDFDRREAWCNGTIRRLPGILTDLLKYFIDNPDSVISREELRGSPIWADSICSSAKEGGKTFDVNVGKLRKIIEHDPTQPQIIISVRGIGWKLARDIIRRE